MNSGYNGDGADDDDIEIISECITVNKKKFPERRHNDPQSTNKASEWENSLEEPTAREQLSEKGQFIFPFGGRRIVDVQLFLSQIFSIGIHKPYKCSVLDMCVTEEKRFGFVSKFKLLCTKCSRKEIVLTDAIHFGHDLNADTVTAIKSLSGDYKSLRKLASQIQVPCMLKVVYDKYENKTEEVCNIGTLQDASTQTGVSPNCSSNEFLNSNQIVHRKIVRMYLPSKRKQPVLLPKPAVENFSQPKNVETVTNSGKSTTVISQPTFYGGNGSIQVSSKASGNPTGVQTVTNTGSSNSDISQSTFFGRNGGIQVSSNTPGNVLKCIQPKSVQTVTNTGKSTSVISQPTFLGRNGGSIQVSSKTSGNVRSTQTTSNTNQCAGSMPQFAVIETDGRLELTTQMSENTLQSSQMSTSAKPVSTQSFATSYVNYPKNQNVRGHQGNPILMPPSVNQHTTMAEMPLSQVQLPTLPHVSNVVMPSPTDNCVSLFSVQQPIIFSPAVASLMRPQLNFQNTTQDGTSNPVTHIPAVNLPYIQPIMIQMSTAFARVPQQQEPNIVFISPENREMESLPSSSDGHVACQMPLPASQNDTDILQPMEKVWVKEEPGSTLVHTEIKEETTKSETSSR